MSIVHGCRAGELQWVLDGFLVALAGMLAVASGVADRFMNDLPASKAGDGSAANQLARQVGGALGIAAIGSLSAAIYAADIRDTAALAG